MDDRQYVRSVDWAIAAWLGSSGLDQPAIRVVARQTPWTMEHWQRPIQVLGDPDRTLHIMEPVWVLLDL